MQIDNFQYFLTTKPLTKNQFYISKNALKLTCRLQQHRISDLFSGMGSGRGPKARGEGVKEKGEGEVRDRRKGGKENGDRPPTIFGLKVGLAVEVGEQNHIVIFRSPNTNSDLAD